MGCVGTEKVTEFEFINSVRGRSSGECRGPLLALSFTGLTLETLEESFVSYPAYALLWSGFTPSDGLITFSLCAAHWMDLSYLAGINGRRHDRADWFNVASLLLRQLLDAAGWDAKEISNMVTWQRVQLT